MSGRRNDSALAEQRGGEVQKTRVLASPSDIAGYVKQSMQYIKARPPASDADCARRLENYFSQCAEQGQMPTVEDMALALGVTPQTVKLWEKDSLGMVRGEMIRRAKALIAGVDAKMVQAGQLPVVSYIFRAKNFYGMRDQTDLAIAPASALGAELSEDELRKRIAEDADDGYTDDLEPAAESTAESNADA